MLAQATKTQAKGFTLVELIVVITILAILATVGFLSLQGYTGDAKNTKTTANLRSVASSLSNEAAISQQAVTAYISGSNSAYATAGSYTFSGVAFTGFVYGKSIAFSGGTDYKAGEVDYNALRIDGTKFFDSTSGSVLKPFAIASASISETSGTSTRSRSVFQIAGTINNAGTQTAIVQGNYSQGSATDMAGLIKGNGGCKASAASADLDDKTGANVVTVVDNGTCVPYQL